MIDSVVPVTPGTKALWVDPLDGKVTAAPVVAWRIMFQKDGGPITVPLCHGEDGYSYGSEAGVEYLDGTITTYELGYFSNREAWARAVIDHSRRVPTSSASSAEHCRAPAELAELPHPRRTEKLAELNRTPGEFR